MPIPTDPDRYSHLEIELNCPKCDAAGLIPLEHLDRLLFCHRCSALFRVEPSGLVELDEPQRESIRVQVRTNSSQWHSEKVVLDRKLTVRTRLQMAAIGLVTSGVVRQTLVVSSFVLVVIGTVLLSRTDRTPAVIDLPTTVEERATLVAEAIARRDVSLLVRVTEPTQHRALRIWLAHAKDLPAQVSHEKSQIRAELVSTAVTTPSGDHLDARVRLKMSPNGKEEFVNQSWVRRGESWYFHPVHLRTAIPRVNSRPAGKR